MSITQPVNRLIVLPFISFVGCLAIFSHDVVAQLAIEPIVTRGGVLPDNDGIGAVRGNAVANMDYALPTGEVVKLVHVDEAWDFNNLGVVVFGGSTSAGDSGVFRSEAVAIPEPYGILPLVFALWLVWTQKRFKRRGAEAQRTRSSVFSVFSAPLRFQIR